MLNSNSRGVPTAESYKTGSFAEDQRHVLSPQMFRGLVCFDAACSDWVRGHAMSPPFTQHHSPIRKKPLMAAPADRCPAFLTLHVSALDCATAVAEVCTLKARDISSSQHPLPLGVGEAFGL